MSTTDISTTPDSCPTSGTLRAHLDLPDAAVEAHLTDCEDCRALTLTLADTAGTVGGLLALLAEPDAGADPAGVLVAATGPPAAPASRVSAGPAGPSGPSGPSGPVGPRTRPARDGRSDPQRRGPLGLRLRTAATGLVVVLAVALVALPAGRGAVAQLLDTFRAEQVEVVPLDLAALETVDLDALEVVGEIDESDLAEPLPVPDAATAEALTGLTPLPLPGETTLYASPGGQVRLTLQANADNGLPDAIDGTVLVIDVPATVVTASSEETMPLFAARAVGLAAHTEGASLADVRDALLASEALPAPVRAQLASITEWETTLPLIVPADQPGVTETTVAGNDAVAFDDGMGLGAALLWVADGEIRVVAGARPLAEIRTLAESL